MSDQRDETSRERDDATDLRESAKQMGVDDADEQSPDDVVRKVRTTASDSEASPSEWREKGDE